DGQEEEQQDVGQGAVHRGHGESGAPESRRRSGGASRYRLEGAAGSARAVGHPGGRAVARGERIDVEGDALDRRDRATTQQGRGEAGMANRFEELLDGRLVESLHLLGGQPLERAVGADVDHELEAARPGARQRELLESDWRKGEARGYVDMPGLGM